MNIALALDRLLEVSGSDLLLSCGTVPRIRREGLLEPLEPGAPALTPADTQRMLREVLDAQQWEDLERRRHVDFAFTWREKARIRANAFYQRGSLAAAFRLLPPAIPNFELRGIPGPVHRLRGPPDGL